MATFAVFRPLHHQVEISPSVVLGVFTPGFAKRSKSLSLIDPISVGVDRMQRNFEPMRKQVETLRELTDVTAKVVTIKAPGCAATIALRCPDRPYQLPSAIGL